MSYGTVASNPNRLANEQSPYLLQHANNPVEWYPWGPEALEKARLEDKPILVSIGYSACHWCHVMERESFESQSVAQIMNENFVNIKVDREERPDIDQIYMEALQTMNLRGGWPLNVFLTADAKPFYGGTYFATSHWVNILNQIAGAYKNNRQDLEHSAEEFTKSLNYTETYKYGLENGTREFSINELIKAYEKLALQFDNKLGGMNKSPKFPMPSIYIFLLRYYHLTNNESALRHVTLTLNKMAAGGLYDQLRGGFARYSTDEEWFAPHFEKMLYDNGQLVSLYSEAFTVTRDQLYKEVILETISWLENEMVSPEGGFYSALDADTEGEEGKFYVWNSSEIDMHLNEDASLFKYYYNVVPAGNWEHGQNILHRNFSDEAFANKHRIDVDFLKEKVRHWKNVLLDARNSRPKPGLDDKIIASWNGIMTKGLVDAYRALDDEKALTLAIANGNFIKANMLQNGKLYHSYKNGQANVDGFLEDYAFVIQGFISLYEATFGESWLFLAKELADYALEHFNDVDESLLYFTSNTADKLIARKKELFDNVIPSSNSTMANNLYLLGLHFGEQAFIDRSLDMLTRLKKLISSDLYYLSNWATLYSSQVRPTVEFAIAGDYYINFRKEIDKYYLPNKVVAGTQYFSNLPLLKGRGPRSWETSIFVCFNKTCGLPVHNVNDALKQVDDAYSRL
ncbi:MAG TPA: thioredoxin domain-containing protein [Cytophagaceae bacterium]|jgi:hypothetical protein